MNKRVIMNNNSSYKNQKGIIFKDCSDYYIITLDSGLTLQTSSNTFDIIEEVNSNEL